MPAIAGKTINPKKSVQKVIVSEADPNPALELLRVFAPPRDAQFSEFGSHRNLFRLCESQWFHGFSDIRLLMPDA